VTLGPLLYIWTALQRPACTPVAIIEDSLVRTNHPNPAPSYGPVHSRKGGRARNKQVGFEPGRTEGGGGKKGKWDTPYFIWIDATVLTPHCTQLNIEAVTKRILLSFSLVMQRFAFSLGVMVVIRHRLVSVGTVQASDHKISIRVKEKHDRTSDFLTHVFALRYHYTMYLKHKKVKKLKVD